MGAIRIDQQVAVALMVKRHVDGERRDGRIVVGGVVDRNGRRRDVVGGPGSARTRGGYRERDLLGRDRAERGKRHRRIDKRSDRLDDWRAISIGQDGVTVGAGEVRDAAGRAVRHGRRVERDPEPGKSKLVVRSHPARKDRCHADHVTAESRDRRWWCRDRTPRRPPR